MSSGSAQLLTLQCLQNSQQNFFIFAVSLNKHRKIRFNDQR